MVTNARRRRRRAGEDDSPRPRTQEEEQKKTPTPDMDPASEELEQRSRYLSSLIRRTKLHAAPALAPPPPPPTPPPEPETKMQLEMEPQPERVQEAAKKAAVAVVEKREVKEGDGGQAGKVKEKGKEERKVSVRVRAADMPLAMQRRAVRLAYDAVAAMPRLDSKRLALALKKEFDTTYGPAWHCIVGTGFGSYVTHSVGGFLYFSIDKSTFFSSEPLSSH